MHPKITIAISTNNRYSLLKNLLISLTKQDCMDFKVIIQDNTPDSSIKIFLSQDVLNFPNFNFIISECEGLSESRNLCVDHCDTEYIHFLDDDLKISQSFISQLIKSITKNKKSSVLGGKVLPYFTEKSDFKYSESCLIYFSTLDFGNETIPFGRENGIPWLVGANLCFKTEKIKDYGYFKRYLGRVSGSGNLLSSEENALVKKIALKEEVVYCPDFPVKHIITREQLNEDWLLRRSSWQGVSDILSGEDWLTDIPSKKQRIETALYNILHEEKIDIDQKMHERHLLCYCLLSGEI